MNGIVEDYITPFHAVELSTWMNIRSEAETTLTRSQSFDIHVPSGQEWWRVAARGYLEQTLPERSDIWHSLPLDISYKRQENEDIRARPLFANYLGASTLISLHTNGSENTAKRGAEAYTYAGRADDLALGSSILCYMKEIIQAQEGYESFPVQPTASDAINHGENRLATMPAVIVEIAYHSNAADAAALQDPVFQKAAMKGVEKGYRLHVEGEPCEPLEINAIPAVAGLHGTTVPVYVNFDGFPQYPLDVEIQVVSCAPGWSCCGYRHMARRRSWISERYRLRPSMQQLHWTSCHSCLQIKDDRRR